MKLSEYAKLKGVHYKTAHNWYHAGRIPGAYQMDTGTIIVPNESEVNPNRQTRVVIYARVSNHSRRKELNYQVKRAEDYAISNGYAIDKVYKEVASGMNDKRKIFWAMLESKPTKIIVENKDRLTRFGFEYLDKLLNDVGCEIEVIHKDNSDENDLIKDLVSVITSFCCRLYGLRRGNAKAKAIMRGALDDCI